MRLFWAELGEVPGVRGPRLDDGDVSTYKDLTVVLDEDVTGISARSLGRALAAEGIDSRHYYDPPIHRQQAYAHLQHGPLRRTERLARSVISPRAVVPHERRPGAADRPRRTPDPGPRA